MVSSRPISTITSKNLYQSADAWAMKVAQAQVTPAAQWAQAERRYVGAHVLPRAPYALDGRRPAVSLPAPTLGEHSAQVLQQAVRSIFGPSNREVGTPAWMSGAGRVGQVTLTYTAVDDAPIAVADTCAQQVMIACGCSRSAIASISRPGSAAERPETTRWPAASRCWRS